MGGALQPANTGFNLARRSKAALKNRWALSSLLRENCSLLRHRETCFRAALPAQEAAGIEPIPEDNGYLRPANRWTGARWRWHGGHAGCHHHASVESVRVHREQHCGFWKLLGRTVDELREASQHQDAVQSLWLPAGSLSGPTGIQGADVCCLCAVLPGFHDRRPGHEMHQVHWGRREGEGSHPANGWNHLHRHRRPGAHPGELGRQLHHQRFLQPDSGDCPKAWAWRCSLHRLDHGAGADRWGSTVLLCFLLRWKEQKLQIFRPFPSHNPEKLSRGKEVPERVLQKSVCVVGSNF